MPDRTLAITGTTGFVGGHVLDRALAAGWRVRALVRRQQPPRPGVEWVVGALADADALDRVLDRVHAMIHVAGIINAPDAAGFMAGNVAGTEHVIAAMRRAGVARLIKTSSLAAREPALSAYGQSKAMAEDVVRQSGLAWTIVRPPAVYGPGDRETLELFRMARLHVMALPPGGRLSVIEAGDLAGLLLDLVDAPTTYGATYEPDDGTPGGISQVQFAEAVGEALDRRVWTLSLPAPVLRAASTIDRLVRGANAKLTADRVAYFTHDNWVCRPEMAPPRDIWRPETPLAAGLRCTARWYREHGWL